MRRHRLLPLLAHAPPRRRGDEQAPPARSGAKYSPTTTRMEDCEPQAFHSDTPSPRSPSSFLDGKCCLGVGGSGADPVGSASRALLHHCGWREGGHDLDGNDSDFKLGGDLRAAWCRRRDAGLLQLLASDFGLHGGDEDGDDCSERPDLL